MINVRPLYRLHAIDYISSQTLRDLFFISTKLNLADTKCKGQNIKLQNLALLRQEPQLSL